jgi:vacuolar-type H+-ATPase subunit H
MKIYYCILVLGVSFLLPVKAQVRAESIQATIREEAEHVWTDFLPELEEMTREDKEKLLLESAKQMKKYETRALCIIQEMYKEGQISTFDKDRFLEYMKSFSASLEERILAVMLKNSADETNILEGSSQSWLHYMQRRSLRVLLPFDTFSDKITDDCSGQEVLINLEGLEGELVTQGLTDKEREIIRIALTNARQAILVRRAISSRLSSEGNESDELKKGSNVENRITH